MSKNKEEFHCKECDKSFSSAYALKYHAILHSNDSKLFYRCPNCDYEGRLVGNLKKHIFNQHYKNRIAEFQAFWENSDKGKNFFIGNGKIGELTAKRIHTVENTPNQTFKKVKMDVETPKRKVEQKIFDNKIAKENSVVKSSSLDHFKSHFCEFCNRSFAVQEEAKRHYEYHLLIRNLVQQTRTCV